MYSFEKDLLCSEIKGLLKKLENVSSDTRHDLAFDNFEDLLDITPAMKAILDRIENKIKEQITEEVDGLYWST